MDIAIALLGKIQAFVPVVITFGVIIFVHELGHFFMAKKEGVRVEIFSLGFGRRLFGRKVGDTDYRVSLVPVGGYVKMSGMVDESMDMEGIKGEPYEFLSKTAWQRLKIILAGVVMNLILALGIFWCGTYFWGIPVVETSTKPIVGTLAPGGPAQKAGLQADDTIVAINGDPITDWKGLTDVIYVSPEVPLAFTIERDGQQQEVSITPRKYFSPDQETHIGLIGITPLIQISSYDKVGFFGAIRESVFRTGYFVVMTYKGIWWLISGKASLKEIGGPIFIGQMAGSYAKRGLGPLLDFIAVISINLAVLNLLPIPILDGGHALFLMCEMVRRRPVSLKVQDVAQRVGLAILLLLMIFVTWNDIFRIFKG